MTETTLRPEDVEISLVVYSLSIISYVFFWFVKVFYEKLRLRKIIGLL